MSQIFKLVWGFVAQLIKLGVKSRPRPRPSPVSFFGAILSEKTSKTPAHSDQAAPGSGAAPVRAGAKKRAGKQRPVVASAAASASPNARARASAAKKGPHGGARPGSGRKPQQAALPVLGKLRQWVTFRIRPDDRGALEKAAAASGWRVGKFARIATLERAMGERLVVLDAGERQLFANALDELRRQGSNLNQIAFAANKVAKGLGKPSELPTAEALASTGRDVKAIVDTLADILKPVVRRVSDVARSKARPKTPLKDSGLKATGREKVK